MLSTSFLQFFDASMQSSFSAAKTGKLQDITNTAITNIPVLFIVSLLWN
jgi:hypothetical protein